MNPQQYTPFIINLTKTSRGYTFHSLEEQQQPLQKPKKAKPVAKANPNKITNRLIKEIGLISDIPPYQQPYANKEVQPEEAKMQFQPLPQEEQIDIEVKRQSGLPPCPAEWFDLKTIHPLEVDLFPQFYSARTYKTPELYQCYRNFMVEAYRKNPLRYLSFVAVRRVLRGDASCLLKIYRFLLEEGIINYGLTYQGNYTFQMAPADKISAIAKRPQSCIKKMPEPAAQAKQEEMDTDNLTVTVINKNFSRTFRVYCSKCKLICGIVWFATNEEVPRNMCFQCYYASDPESVRQFSKVDILKKMESAKDGKQPAKTSWGLQDNIRLLEFMGSCRGRNWEQLMNQFEGKKTLEDIIIQFMQFPITNFDPQLHGKTTRHEEIDYTHQEHIDMVLDLYRKSHHANRETKTEEEERKTDYRGEEAPNFKTYSSLIVRKYLEKIENLRKMQTTLQEANLSIVEQPLCKRMRISNYLPKEEGQEIGQEDE